MQSNEFAKFILYNKSAVESKIHASYVLATMLLKT